MKQGHTNGRENSRELWVLHPLLGERAGVRVSVSSNLLFGVARDKLRRFLRARNARFKTQSPANPGDSSANHPSHSGRASRYWLHTPFNQICLSSMRRAVTILPRTLP